MSEKKITVSAPGIGFGGLLTIVFITLKLTHVIAWSWWWVLSPLWIGVLLSIAVMFLITAFALLFAAIAVWVGQVK